MNYTEIQDQIRSILKRGTSLDSDIPTWITLAESDIKAEISDCASLETITLTLLAGQDTVTYPAGLELVRLDIDFTEYTEPLQIVATLPPSDDDLLEPSFVMADGDNLRFDTKADQNYTIKAQMYGEPDIASTTTNWLSDKVPAAYIYGALLHSTVKTQADASMYSAMYASAINSAKLINRKRRGSTKLRLDDMCFNSGLFNIATGDY